jgi:uncharacterized protein (TIGR02145 family)
MAAATIIGAGCPAPCNAQSGSFKTVTIDGVTWMVENLNIETGNSWCYDDDEAYCKKYGRLYDWETAQNACPAGWHLSTRGEWFSLFKYAGEKLAAEKKLKAKSGWNDYIGNDGNGADNYGFSALPGGRRLPGGGFVNAGNAGWWWTNKEPDAYVASNTFYAYYRRMRHDSETYAKSKTSVYDAYHEHYHYKGYGISVRCVGD